ncbi:MAG: hypothetical protein R3E93_07060 [Thiothrix sp.]
MLDMTMASCLPSPLQLACSGPEVARTCHFRRNEYRKIYPKVQVTEHDPFNNHAYVLYTSDADGNISSTGSLVMDSAIGLPEDGLFPAVVDDYRRSGKRLMEIGRFVIRGNLNLVKHYYKAAHAIAVRQGIDSLLMVIRQKDVLFHQKRLGAELLAEDVGEDFGSGQPFACMAWDVSKTTPAFLRWVASL